MTLPEPIEIDLLTFIKTGKFDYIKLGQTKEWIINNFPDPDGISEDDFRSQIWYYGNIEFHFNNQDELILIFSDYIDTLTGGPSLQLSKWIFDKPEELIIANVVSALTTERIGYMLEYGELSDGYTSISIYSLKSGIKFLFILPEREDEDYEQYLVRLQSTDSNLFRLSSISLTSR